MYKQIFPSTWSSRLSHSSALTMESLSWDIKSQILQIKQ